jgi:hypothetical protein
MLSQFKSLGNNILCISILNFKVFPYQCTFSSINKKQKRYSPREFALLHFLVHIRSILGSVCAISTKYFNRMIWYNKLDGSEWSCTCMLYLFVWCTDSIRERLATGGCKSSSHWLLYVFCGYCFLHHILIQLCNYIVKPDTLKLNESTVWVTQHLENMPFINEVLDQLKKKGMFELDSMLVLP